MSAWFTALTGHELLHPAMLLWALLVPLIVAFRRWFGAPAVRFAPAKLLEGTPPSLRIRLLPAAGVLHATGLLLLSVALARPVERVRLPVQLEGIDILLCLDVSSSMAEKDLDPERTRLDLAKEAAARFIAGRPEDRIGLVRFARFPDLLCPLTLDHSALLEFLGQLERVEEDGPEDRTGIGTAVARAAQVLRDSTSRSKVVVLLTDGEENVATAETPDEIGPRWAGRLCQDAGVRVYTIAAGIGRRDRTGAWRALDTTEVEELATGTGGAFYEVRDAAAMEEVYRTIDAMEKAAFEEPRFELRERFLPWLAAGLILLLCGALWSDTTGRVAP